MGGSLAYALRGFKDGIIVGYDPDEATQKAALKAGAVDAIAFLPEEAVKKADLVLFCSAPSGIFANMPRCFPHLKPGAVVSEICGVKGEMLRFVQQHLPSHARYVGLHPMAGKEIGGFANAEGALFQGAGFILVPPEPHDESALALLRALSAYVGAGRVVVNDAAAHDLLIGYSSDLMHIAATALVEEYPCGLSLAHTAGAFRDCTRVARIDAKLWRELLLGNAESITPHLDALAARLAAFSAALKAGDGAFIESFLSRANENRLRIDKL
jgi:prephenate dehydrogenase